MNVQYWYKKPTYQSRGIHRPTSKGLKVNGVKYTWKEVEAKWGLSGRTFTKRYHANPGWPMEDLLTKPMQNKNAVKKRAPNLNGSKEEIRQSRSGGNAHLPEQLWANEVACSRWV